VLDRIEFSHSHVKLSNGVIGYRKALRGDIANNGTFAREFQYHNEFGPAIWVASTNIAKFYLFGIETPFANWEKAVTQLIARELIDPEMLFWYKLHYG
jgi:hypothetical protein